MEEVCVVLLGHRESGVLLLLSVIATLSSSATVDQAAQAVSPSEHSAEYRRKVRLYGERLAVGEVLRVGVEVPTEDSGELMTAFANVAMTLFDADDSGGLNQKEWLERAWRFELLFDSNGDNAVSREEYLAGRGGGDPRGNADYEEFLARFRQEDVRRFRRLSSSGAPFTRRALARESRQTFRINDHNRDGQVTREDLRSLGRPR